MSPDLIQRYQRGGDIWESLAEQYGVSAADLVAQAALTGESSAVTDAIAQVRNGNPQTGTSTLGNFFNQLVTDPFAAPLDTANAGIGTVLGSALKGLFRNPWLLLVAGVVIFWALGGFTWLRKKTQLA